MSYTEICAIEDGKEPVCIGEVRNAWRGAMYVWNDIANRYFNTDFPTWGNNDLQSRIWNAWNDKPLSLCESIVLLTTMDKATVKKNDVGSLLHAFREYAEKHPESSIGEQADLIQSAQLEDGQLIAWVQTSVSEGWFAQWSEEDECDKTNTEGSFDVFEYANELRTE